LLFLLFWGGVKVWKWAIGEGPPALRPDTDRIEVNTFLTATVEYRERRNKFVRFAKKIWWWIY
jgi:hypothetical protein